MKVKKLPFYLGLIFLPIFFVACQISIDDVGVQLEKAIQPPRVLTLTARKSTPIPTAYPTLSSRPATVTSQTTPEYIVLTPLPTKPKPLIVWLNEDSAEAEAAVKKIGATFQTQFGRDVEFIYIDSDSIPELARIAKEKNQLPDIIFHNLEQNGGLLKEGIIDPIAATSVIKLLGESSFWPQALTILPPQEGNYPAIPSDGWQQLVIYRKDWFNSAELPPPDNFDALLQAATQFHTLDYDAKDFDYDETVKNADKVVTGITLPTEQDLPMTQRVFEQFALANGCSLINPDGTTGLSNPNCLATFQFYTDLINQYSPLGYQTDVSAMKGFLGGRTSIIVTTPNILPMLAGVDPLYLPQCTECQQNRQFLIANSGFLTHLEGNSTEKRPISVGQINYLGITSSADSVTAEQFAQWWFTEGYTTWLSVKPETKLPLRHGEGDDNRYWDAWRNLPVKGSDQSLDQLIQVDGKPISDLLLDGLVGIKRWGISEGNSSLTSAIYETPRFAPILQRMLSGFVTPEDALVSAESELANFIPTPIPTPEATPAP